MVEQGQLYISDEPIFTSTRYVPRGTHLREDINTTDKFNIVLVPTAEERFGRTKLVQVHETLLIPKPDLTKLSKIRSSE